MKTWNQLFVRTGWLLKEKQENVFDCAGETTENMEFLTESLNACGVRFSQLGDMLFMDSAPISEAAWLAAVDYKYRGRTVFWFRPGVQEPVVRELDAYICGIVRQLNRLGFMTTMSCDGHGRRRAFVDVTKEVQIQNVTELLLAVGMKRVHYKEVKYGYKLLLPLDRGVLLDLAEKLSAVDVQWLGNGPEHLNRKLFECSLEELLAISGESGNESAVRDAVKEKLVPFVDYVTVDRAGNLLAEKPYGSGNGPIILLNAHLDTVYEIEQGREIEKDGDIWRSSAGILGADDRAGVAALLHVAKVLNNSQSFNGKVKYVFTVEEECGLVGARQVDEHFLWGVDAAIVADRRGNRDIVVSCGGSEPFCDGAYGEFFEKVTSEADLGEWKCTPGGSSDTRVWAGHGIQSVNLSVGYGNEHTDREFVDVGASYRAARLVLRVLEKARELEGVLRGIRVKEKFKVS